MKKKVDIHFLKNRFPTHVAFNLALLIREIRHAIQIDFQGETKDQVQRWVETFVSTYNGVDTISTGNGILLFMRQSKKPRQVRAALDALLHLPPGTRSSQVNRLVGAALELVCPVRNLSAQQSFRVMVGVIDEEFEPWYFKQQMCVRASSIVQVFKELEKYDSLASEMGMVATTMTVVRRTKKLT